MLGDLQEKKIKRLFDVHDSNKDGVLTYSDFKRIGSNFSSRGGDIDFVEMFTGMWNEISDMADLDKDGEVTISEWNQFWNKALSSEEGYDSFVTKFGESFFTLLDRDGDLKITLDEYRDYLKAFEYENIDIEGSFNSFTKNSPTLSLERAREVGAEFFLSNDDVPGNSLFGYL